MVAIVLGILVLIGLVVVFCIFKSYADIITREFKPDETIIKGDGKNKKALILYVPSKHDSAEIIKNNTAQKLVQKGYTVHINYPSSESSYNYDEFEIICYISPVYMSRVSMPMCELMISSNYQKKKVIIISVGLEMDKKEELNYMQKNLNQLNEFNLIKVKKEDIKKLNDFLEGATL